MMKQMKGGLPGQKVFKWDRLNEYKMFTKKMNNEISEIEVEENESILSRESTSVINRNLLEAPVSVFKKRTGNSFEEINNVEEEKLSRPVFEEFSQRAEDLKGNYVETQSGRGNYLSELRLNDGKYVPKRVSGGKLVSKFGNDLER